jgi:hypothetical protein
MPVLHFPAFELFPDTDVPIFVLAVCTLLTASWLMLISHVEP